MGLRVIMIDGGRVTTTGAILRNILRIVDMMFYNLPIIVSVAATRRYQRFGDFVGKTMVIKESNTLPGAPTPLSTSPSTPASSSVRTP